jgi:hypothetical protein
MTPLRIAEAQKMAREWVPKSRPCVVAATSAFVALESSRTILPHFLRRL